MTPAQQLLMVGLFAVLALGVVMNKGGKGGKGGKGSGGNGGSGGSGNSGSEQ